MPPPKDNKKSGGRLTGEDLMEYMESFTDRFLQGRMRYNTIVTNIRRDDKDSDSAGRRWVVSVRDRDTGAESQLRYHRIVLCTGVRTREYR